jgi:NitT/TauT family transport system ATP-binding protein
MALVVDNVAKEYGEGASAYLALDGVDLAIRDGEFLCLLGASGCGKTTLLNILAGFEQPTRGRVTLNGRPIRGAGPDRMLFFQDAGEALFPWLSAAENVEFGLKFKGFAKAERSQMVARYLQMVGLGEHAAKVPAQLSGGMRQRLQIARALAIEPEVLLMDEPFAALDAISRRRMHVELLDIWQQTRKTIVFVTHDIAESIVLADRIAIMNVGPGSNIARLFDVELSRPRHLGQQGFGELHDEIEAAIGGDAVMSSRAATDRPVTAGAG